MAAPDKKMTGKSRVWLLGAAAVLSGTVLRMLMAYVAFLQADEEIFSYDAYYIVLGRPFLYVMERIGAYIAYPVVLSGWFEVAGVSLTGARVLTVLIYGAIIVMTYTILMVVSRDEKASFLGTLLLSVLPFPLRYGHVVLSEPMAWFFITASILLAVIVLKGGRWYLMVPSGALAAMAFFVRRSALILLPAVLGMLVWTNRRHLKGILREAVPWGAGFLTTITAALGGFIAFFGFDRLNEIRWTKVPHMSSGWDLDLGGSSYGNALFVLQPTLWKSLPLFILLMTGLSVIVISLFRNRWKAVYPVAFLWSAAVRVAFDGELSGPVMMIVSLLPAIPLLRSSSFDKGQDAALALSVLAGSAVAFSTTSLSGDIWNVVIYSAVGGLLLLYLEDRMGSALMTPVFLLVSLGILFYLTDKEPQVGTLVSVFASVLGPVYLMTMGLLKQAPKNMHLIVLSSIAVLLIAGGRGTVPAFAASLLLIALSLLVYFKGSDGKWWTRYGRLFSMGALLFIPLVDPDVPLYGFLAAVPVGIAMLPFPWGRGASRERFELLAAVLSGAFAFIIVIYATDSLTLAGAALCLVGCASVSLLVMRKAALHFAVRVGEKVSLLLVALVIGYLAFYVYYAWTEVYLSEFIVAAVLVGGLLCWVLLFPMRRARAVITGKKVLSRMVSRIDPGAVAVLFAFILISIPVSASAFIADDWFREGPMDQRPYMRTIREVAGWIEDNTGPDDKIVAWHCYAIEADRETLLEVSNAAVYDGGEVALEMEGMQVNVFVRCYYTDNGLWKDQPDFQDYVLTHYHIVRVVDGNECWLRNGR